MGFLQIIDFHTDRIEEFIALERTWEVDSAGARTSTGGQLFADRDHPGHYVALDWFTDYDSAMVNSDAAPRPRSSPGRRGTLSTERGDLPQPRARDGGLRPGRAGAASRLREQRPGRRTRSPTTSCSTWSSRTDAWSPGAWTRSRP